MNAERQLLRDKGDQQFKYCPPTNFSPCQVIEVYSTHLAVLKRFYPVLNSRGLPIQFPVMTVWASSANEMHSFSHSFSLS